MSLSLSIPSDLAERADSACAEAVGYLAEHQTPDGSWSNDYTGPMFLLPMYITMCRVVGVDIPEERSRAMAAELIAAMGDDGGVGLHRGGPSCMMTTVLAYVSLRLLGNPAEREECQRLRRWILHHGSALSAAPWAKWCLCLLHLYPYRGLNPVPPELWLLPRWFPLHPGRLWCHCRMVYLPASYLYASRSRIDEDDLIRSLRREIYAEDWDRIDFAAHRNNLCPADTFHAPRWPVRMANRILLLAESILEKRGRRASLDEVARQIEFEDTVTGQVGIGPVNRVLNTICHHFRDPDGPLFRQGLEACEQYLWEEPGRCGMQGYQNSRLWDTAFAAQAISAAGGAERAPAVLAAAHRFVLANRLNRELPHLEEYHRSPSLGGWPFSLRAHGWPITDCTAEGVKCTLLLGEDRPAEAEVSETIRLFLHWQNPDGGWPTYERARAGSWMEAFNPSGAFERIMIDYSYPECTSSVLQALVLLKRHFPDLERDKIDRAIRRGERYLRRQQRPDGSWEGSWGVCFTYGTWFGVAGLVAAGAGPEDPALIGATEFLRAHQHRDGGWGEEIESCWRRHWIDRPSGHVVQTAWALLALLDAGTAGSAEACRRAAQFLVERQQKDGNWPNEGMVGIFNRTCAINYDGYRTVFPLWALARWQRSADTLIASST